MTKAPGAEHTRGFLTRRQSELVPTKNNEDPVVLCPSVDVCRHEATARAVSVPHTTSDPWSFVVGRRRPKRSERPGGEPECAERAPCGYCIRLTTTHLPSICTPTRALLPALLLPRPVLSAPLAGQR